MEHSNSRKYVLGVDVGTTNIRSYVYDTDTNVVGMTMEEVNVLCPDEGKSEMDPQTLWESFKSVVRGSMLDAKINAEHVISLGISTQRGTFLTWDRETGEPFHNFITWKDKRASEMCEEWNTSCAARMLRFGAWLLYLVTRSNRMLAASKFRVIPHMVVMRLVWVLHNILQVRKDIQFNKVAFGTVDTWLVWKLTGGKIHATDESNASATGFFDTYQLRWARLLIRLFAIPSEILPDVKSASDCYGETLPDLFGSSLPINAVVGDQQASMFGQCCFTDGDINLTMGTGTFLAINTGPVACVMRKNIFPMVGWTLGGKTTYMAESSTSDTGTIIAYAKSWGLMDDIEQMSDVAFSLSDNGGVYFLPPSNELTHVHKHSNPQSSTSHIFSGLKQNTTKDHLVRAILEALAFQAYSMYKSLPWRSCNIDKLCICGGVSNNDFIVQLLANLTDKPVARPLFIDSSSLGAAFLAGLTSGVWKNVNELSSLQKEEKLFLPQHELTVAYRDCMKKWEKKRMNLHQIS